MFPSASWSSEQSITFDSMIELKVEGKILEELKVEQKRTKKEKERPLKDC